MKWTTVFGGALAVVAGMVAGAYLDHRFGASWLGRDAAPPPPATADEEHAPADTHSAQPGVVELDEATTQRLGVRTAKVQATSAVPTQAVPGRLIADPGLAFALRAPLPGRIVAGAQPLPRLGDTVAAGQVIATLVPRLTPAERVDLAQRRAQATAERDAAARALTVAHSDLERQRALHANGNAASQRDVELAEVEVASQTARQTAAEEVLRTLPEAGSGALELTAPRAGIVDAVFAHPDENVEAGTVLLQGSDVSQLLARIEVAAGVDVDPGFASARIDLLGVRGEPLAATRRTWSDAGAGDRAVLLELRSPGPDVRPGLPVVAFLPRRTGAQAGILLAESAIVRRGDGAFVYLRQASEAGHATFQRVAVELDAPLEGGWLVTAREGTPEVGAELVVAGAGALYSIERQRTTDAEEGD